MPHARSHGCVVEDLHGHPAPRPLSLSCSLDPPRSTQRSALASRSGLGHREPPLDGSDDSVRRSTGEALPGDRHLAAAGTVGIGTLASSMSGLHMTQSGIVVPPIHGIPRPEGLPPETAVAYAKVKVAGRRGLRGSRTAAKGAFSNMTSVAVLQHVRPLESNTRQVEPAGWAPLVSSPLHSESDRESDGAPVQRTATSAAARASSASSAGSRDAASVTSLTPSEALMVAAAREEDAAAAAANADGHNGAVSADDDDDEQQAMRVRAILLQQQQQHLQQQHQHQQQQRHESRRSVPTRSASPPARRVGAAAVSERVARYGGEAVEDAAPYAIRTAASAQRSPVTPPRPATAPVKAAPTSSPAARGANRRPAPPVPRNLECYMEKGQQRRAEAERARLARAAEAAGTATATTDAGDETHAARRPRKLSVMPLPRGYAPYALKGRSRRAEATREEEARLMDDAVNCTHKPRVNKSSAAAPASAVSVFERLAEQAVRREGRQPPPPADHPTPPPTGSAARTRPRAAGRSVFEELYAQSRKEGRAAARAAGAEEGAEVSGASPTPAMKRSHSAIAQHLALMQMRDDERRARQEKLILASQAAEEGRDAESGRPGRVPPDVKTDELAERARARYRAREERTKQMEEATVPRVAAAAPPQRSARERRVGRAAPPVEEGEPATKAADNFIAHQRQTEERRQRRIEQLRLQCAEAEVSECTFRPRLNDASAAIAQRSWVAAIDTAAAEERSGNSPRADSAWQAGHRNGALEHSPYISSRSRSLLRELNRASPLESYDDSRDSSDDGAYVVHGTESLERTATAPPHHPAGPLAEQLRHLEDMLREWKELERECSPMLQQPRKAGVV
ncbi:hypothetical protein NESM_000204900 [Novymonas esmeraldas]|uniref:Uncharacterized protein n=1 Tax=Novymonas esmeraldas TaxID=1808958 RepID=A0AAW0F4B0_9TRYP